MTTTGPIVTLTLNPALDLSTAVDAVTVGHKLRCDAAERHAGGGGVNVSRVSKRLGVSTVAVLPLGGPEGASITDLLDSEGIARRVAPIAGHTRQAFAVSDRSNGDQYRFVLPGAALSSEEIVACLDAVVSAAEHSRFVVVSSSFPPDTDVAIVAELVAALPNASVIVDTSGPALRAALQSGAFLVKPSARELADVSGSVLRTEAEVEQAARTVMASANVEVLVASIGPGGAIVVTGDGTALRFRAPTVDVRNTIGAGDSMVAGIAVGLQRELSLEDAIRFGIAAGTAAVLTDATQLCVQSDVEALLPLVAGETVP